MELTPDQEEARKWLEDQADMVVCPVHNARLSRKACIKRVRCFMEYSKGGSELSDKQADLRSKWSGCADCEVVRDVKPRTKEERRSERKRQPSCCED